MKKYLLVFAFFISSLFGVYSLETKFQLGFSPSLMLNTDTSLNSAPSPIVTPINFAINLKIKENFCIEPRLSFFYYYSLWANNRALPAEIENRTGTTFSFMLDCPFDFTKTFNKNHIFQIGAGPSFLIRFATLSNNVNADDYGVTGSAQGDLSCINSWFWQNANFLFIKAHALYLYKFNSSVQAGPEFSFSLPIGSFIENNPLHNALISAGIQFRF